MRVALFTDGIWPYVLGGMQKHSFYLCKYLAQNKVHVDLFHFNQSDYDISKLEFFSEDEKKYIHPTIIDFPDSPRFPGHYIYNSYRYSRLIFDSVKDKLSTYDFIYTKGFSGWYLINQKRQHRIQCAPIGVKFHGFEMFQKPPDFKALVQNIFLLRKPVSYISKNADVVFSYGGKITTIIKSIGVPENKIFELPSGVEESVLADNINPSGKIRKFLYLGRYERRKGVEELNFAIKLLLTKDLNHQYEFHFVGPIPDEKKVKHNSIIYHGEIRDKDALQQLIRNCDVLICPSWSEGMPNVILEAMAKGLAVIATNVGATNILVNQNTGWLLNSSASNEILSAIESVIKMPDGSLDQMKHNALKLITDNFTWEKLSEKLVEALKSFSLRITGSTTV